MEISYQLTEDDYRQGYKAFQVDERNTLFGLAVLVTLFSFVILAIAVYVSIFGPDRSFPNMALLWGLVAFWGLLQMVCPSPHGQKMITGSPVRLFLILLTCPKLAFTSELPPAIAA